MNSKDSEIAGVTIDREKMRVFFEKPVNMLTDVVLKELLDSLNDKDKSANEELTIQKYHSIAEKIVEGLLESGFLSLKNERGYWEVYFTEVPPPSKETLVKAIANALLENLVYGNLGTLTLRNNKGQIVAKLYILPDGTLADDSWLNNEGWKR